MAPQILILILIMESKAIICAPPPPVFFGLEQQNKSAGFYLRDKLRVVLLKPTSVSEEHIASVFTVEI
jgi:hypothetical protein